MRVPVLLFLLLSSFANAAQPVQPPTLDQRLAHVFDRLAYGARPGDLERWKKKGAKAPEAWIAEQLTPIALKDDDADQKIARLPAVGMTSTQLFASYRRLEDIAMDMGVTKDQLKEEDRKKELRKKIGEEKLPEQIVRELTAQRLIRAVESRRQLQEVMVDFWLNHFNVDISKGEERWLMPEFERDVIRKFAFGNFRDLLKATAHSPAMLFYLDNHLSSAGKLNENYAREILELHTLGVDGGYSQRDVTELARILTGWSIADMRKDPAFKFKEKQHDRGEKTFLGKTYPANEGQEEGERALDIIANHPATAKFIATKLTRAFVSDKPPAALVARLAQVFIKTKGELIPLYRALFSSPEFWSREAYRAKVKKPIHFVASAIRALGGELETKNDLPKILNDLGEEPYRCAPPTGYKDEASAWVNPGAMINRLNFAVKVSANRVNGVYTQLPRIEPVPKNINALVRTVATQLLHERLSPASEKIVLREFEDEHRVMADGEIRPLSLAKATGLILGSPEFQRR